MFLNLKKKKKTKAMNNIFILPQLSTDFSHLIPFKNQIDS